MARKRYNNQSGLIDVALASGGTVLTSSALAALPAVSGADYVPIVLDPGEVAGTPEFAYITAHTAAATTATILRGQEGSAARAHAVSIPWEHVPTVADFESELVDNATIEVANGQHRVKAAGIGPTEIADGGVGANELATGAVTGPKIPDASVVPAKLSPAGSLPLIVCTSGTRPGSPTVGQAIYESDTGNTLWYHGPVVTWRPAWNSKWGSVNTPKKITADQGSITAEVDVVGAASYTFTAVANRRYKHTVKSLIANTNAGSGVIIRIYDITGAPVEIDQEVCHAGAGASKDTLAWTFSETGLTAGAKTRKLTAQATANTGSLQNATSALQWSIEDDGPNGLPS